MFNLLCSLFELLRSDAAYTSVPCRKSLLGAVHMPCFCALKSIVLSMKIVLKSESDGCATR